MSRVLTITLNPAVDLFGSVAQVAPERKLRCNSERRDPGGGGLNVARVVHRFGGDVAAAYLRGGVTGRLLDELLNIEKLDGVALSAKGETRQNLTIFETETSREYRFVFPGPRLEPEEWPQILDRLRPMLENSSWLVLSGSLPSGAPADAYAQLARLGKAAGARIAVDAAGPALRAALGERVCLIKPNLDELRELVGAALEDLPSRAAAARDLVRRGAAEIVALTMGSMGALLATRDEVLFADALKIDPVSSIGAGDSFMGALIWALKGDWRIQDGFCLAVAAGAAALLTPGTGLCQRSDVDALAAKVKILSL